MHLLCVSCMSPFPLCGEMVALATYGFDTVSLSLEQTARQDQLSRAKAKQARQPSQISKGQGSQGSIRSRRSDDDPRPNSAQEKINA